MALFIGSYVITAPTLQNQCNLFKLNVSSCVTFVHCSWFSNS